MGQKVFCNHLNKEFVLIAFCDQFTCALLDEKFQFLP